MNRFLSLVFCLLLFVSCNLNKKKPAVTEALTGNWLVLYPDHQLRDDVQEKIYAKSQDSIVKLMGLKLISFRPGGEVQLVDSLFTQKGNWQMAANELKVRNAGAGWEAFDGRLVGFKEDTLQIVEYIPLRDEDIRVIWYLKKINGDHKAAVLFDSNSNTWRQKPEAPDSKPVIRKKVKDMLEYYAVYFETVAEESSYFTAARVFLPFKYYQHAVGLLPFNENDAFSRLFYDATQAKIAYEVLEDAFEKIRKKDFPSGKNYVIEYSKFFKKLAETIGNA